jgi:spermidine synthase
VTTVEIDPIIHRYAVDYFHLPSNHTSIVDNAITYVSSATKRESEKYTYIIHDVFTGGAEPASLFTVEFLSELRSLLKPDGVIVIVREISLPFSREDRIQTQKE